MEKIIEDPMPEGAAANEPAETVRDLPAEESTLAPDTLAPAAADNQAIAPPAIDTAPSQTTEPPPDLSVADADTQAKEEVAAPQPVADAGRVAASGDSATADPAD